MSSVSTKTDGSRIKSESSNVNTPAYGIWPGNPAEAAPNAGPPNSQFAILLIQAISFGPAAGHADCGDERQRQGRGTWRADRIVRATRMFVRRPSGGVAPRRPWRCPITFRSRQTICQCWQLPIASLRWRTKRLRQGDPEWPESALIIALP